METESDKRRNGERLLTAREVASLLRINLSTVYLWAQQGRLPHVCLSEGLRRRCVRFSAKAIEEWIQERTKAGQLDRVLR